MSGLWGTGKNWSARPLKLVIFYCRMPYSVIFSQGPKQYIKVERAIGAQYTATETFARTHLQALMYSTFTNLNKSYDSSILLRCRPFFQVTTIINQSFNYKNITKL